MRQADLNVFEEDGVKYDSATPFAEYLIKSIAEQGYSLETSLADLIDNSVTAGAKRVEILIDTNNAPFTLFLADDGSGMSEEALKRCMQFPSASLETDRHTNDLGRFGLGMKTASFAQTRKLTVISRAGKDQKYSARTWDVDYLKKKQEWRIIINNEEEITNILASYNALSTDFLSEYSDFTANTIVAWQGLYKFEEYLDGEDKSKSLYTQITKTTTEYLSLVFHRFLERKVNPLSIRVNNIRIIPFNPFPTDQPDLRLIESKQRSIKTDVIKLEGFVLPARSIEESKSEINIWTMRSKGLLDMEGLYIYRADRIILFGGWNGIIRKSPRLQLARLRVEVGNKVDHLLHLNVAKSQISIPYDLKSGFLKYMTELRDQAEKEYYNRGIRKFSSKKADFLPQLFERKSSNKGLLLEINNEFPLIKTIMDNLTEEHKKSFIVLNKMINNTINKIRQSHEDRPYVEIEESNASSGAYTLLATVQALLDNKTDKHIIKECILPSLGYRLDTVPREILNLLD